MSRLWRQRSRPKLPVPKKKMEAIAGQEGLEGGLGLYLAVSRSDEFHAFPCWPCRFWRRT